MKRSVDGWLGDCVRWRDEIGVELWFSFRWM